MNSLVRNSAIALSSIVAMTQLSNAQSRETIQIAGSSTVLPFSAIVSEEFGASGFGYRAPVVASGGTGGGLKQLCAGIGNSTIDIANASRPMKQAERDACAANGVTDVREIQFGFDGIVFASSGSRANFVLTTEHIFKAASARVPVDGKLVENPYTRWDQIDPSLPSQRISLAIPASNHGTREVFEERVMHPGCEKAGMPHGTSEDQCLDVRRDVLVEIAGDYTETLARLIADPDTVGVFGLSFFDQNRDKLKVASIDGIVPSLETIADGTYSVSRPLYFYVKGDHLDYIKGLREFVEFYLSDIMVGSGGMLENQGLIPQASETTQAELDSFISKR